MCPKKGIMSHYYAKHRHNMIRGVHMEETTTGMAARPSDSPLVSLSDADSLPCLYVDPSMRVNRPHLYKFTFSYAYE